MNRKSLITTILLSLCLVLIAHSPVKAAISLDRQLEKLDLELKLSGIKFLRTQKKEIKLLKKIESSRKKIKSLKNKVDDKDLKIENLNLNISTLESHIQRMGKRVIARMTTMKKKIGQLYRFRIEPYVNSILGSKNIPDVIYRFHLLKVLIKRDKREFRAFKQLKKRERKEIAALIEARKKLIKTEGSRKKNERQIKREIAKLKKSLKRLRLEKSVMAKRLDSLLTEREEIKQSPQPSKTSIAKRKIVRVTPAPVKKWQAKKSEHVAKTDKQNKSNADKQKRIFKIRSVAATEKALERLSGIEKLESLVTAAKPERKGQSINNLLLHHGEKTKSLTKAEMAHLLSNKKKTTIQKESRNVTILRDSITRKTTPGNPKLNTVQFIRPTSQVPQRTTNWGSSKESPTLRKGLNYFFNESPQVRSAADGKVLFRGIMGSLGKVVIINHHKGYSTLYSHLKSFQVRIGQRLQKGQIIGSGEKTEDGDYRVHFEVRHYGTAINPENLMS